MSQVGSPSKSEKALAQRPGLSYKINGLRIIYFAISCIYFFSSYIIPIPDTILGVCRFWGVGILVQLIFFLTIFYIKNKTIVTPYLIFLMGALVCWFGQIFVIMFDLRTDTAPIILSFDVSSFYHTVQYAAMSFFIMSSLALFLVRKDTTNTLSQGTSDRAFMSSATITGVLLAFVGGYPYISTLVSNLLLSKSDGYSEIFSTSEALNPASNILANFSMFFIPGLLMIFVANKNNIVVRRLLLLFILFIIVTSLTTGGRSGAISLIVAMLWLYAREISNFGKAKTAILIASGLVFIRILNALAEYRTLMAAGLDSFIALVISGKSGGGDTIGNIFNEFGFNIFSLHHTMSLIPSQQDFAHGYTYFASLMAVIPSLISGHSFSTDAALPQWLQRTLGMDYGPGYSITAESYYNFGWLGFGAMLAIGILLIALFSNRAKRSEWQSLRNAFIAVVLYGSLFIARDTSLLVVRKYFYMVIVPTLLFMLIYSLRTYSRRKVAQ